MFHRLIFPSLLLIFLLASSPSKATLSCEEELGSSLVRLFQYGLDQGFVNAEQIEKLSLAPTPVNPLSSRTLGINELNLSQAIDKQITTMTAQAWQTARPQISAIHQHYLERQIFVRDARNMNKLIQIRFLRKLNGRVESADQFLTTNNGDNYIVTHNGKEAFVIFKNGIVHYVLADGDFHYGSILLFELPNGDLGLVIGMYRQVSNQTLELLTLDAQSLKIKNRRPLRLKSSLNRNDFMLGKDTNGRNFVAFRDHKHRKKSAIEYLDDPNEPVQFIKRPLWTPFWTHAVGAVIDYASKKKLRLYFPHNQTFEFIPFENDNWPTRPLPEIRTIEVGPDHVQFYFVDSVSKQLNLMDVQNGKLLNHFVMNEPLGHVSELKMIPTDDHGFIVATRNDGSAQFWRLDHSLQGQQIEIPVQNARSFGYYRDSYNRLNLIFTLEGRVQIYDENLNLRTDLESRTHELTQGYQQKEPYVINLSGGERLIAYSSGDQTFLYYIDEIEIE